jgi:hypothetical protein
MLFAFIAIAIVLLIKSIKIFVRVVFAIFCLLVSAMIWTNYNPTDMIVAIIVYMKTFL